MGRRDKITADASDLGNTETSYMSVFACAQAKDEKESHCRQIIDQDNSSDMEQAFILSWEEIRLSSRFGPKYGKMSIPDQ